MKIINKNTKNQILKFSDVNPGELFNYSGETWVKIWDNSNINRLTSRVENLYANAISIKCGSLGLFANFDRIDFIVKELEIS